MMRYFGSKASATEWVYEIISDRIPAGTFCDPFGGIGTIGSFFKSKGFSVWSGDILTFAHCFQIARLGTNRIPAFRGLREAMNLTSVAGVVDSLNQESRHKGWFVEEYAKKRRFFTEENATRIEACRLRIEEWSRKELLTKEERAILVASLINSMDRVANTAGTYYAYLKGWHRKALQAFRFTLIPFTAGSSNCMCFLGEAHALVSKRFFDVVYLDPPYNERSYARYYHLPETLALGETPDIHGKSGVPNRERTTSDFNRPQHARYALERLVQSGRCRLLAFHYSDDGLIRQQDIEGILSDYGPMESYVLDSRGYTTSSIKRNTEQRLYVVDHGQTIA